MTTAADIREELAADRLDISRVIALFERLQERFRVLTEDPNNLDPAALRELQREVTAARGQFGEIANRFNTLSGFINALPPGPERNALESERQALVDSVNNTIRSTVQPFVFALNDEVERADQQLANAAADFTQAPAPVANNVSAIFDSEGTAPNNWGVWNNDTGTWIRRGLTQQQALLDEQELSTATEPAQLQTSELEFFQFDENGNPVGSQDAQEQRAAVEQAAAKARTINQATLQSRYKQPGSTDWRVRLQLAPSSDYLYNAPGSEGGAGILAPLKATNGVIFPYTPQINTVYKARYADYDLIHSNYRGIFYQNSRLDDIGIRAIFTAQDTREADYLLAVIHFFRSVTKMFYGKDAQRGSPPPLVFLSGYGTNQFYGHPCVVSSFQYNLPEKVDYIRATNPNNYGTNLLNRRTPTQASFGGAEFAGARRLANALLPKAAEPIIPTASTVAASVNNTQLANYVPTRMELDISLIPVQTRSQVSKQFSLRDFANGNLIKGGFW